MTVELKPLTAHVWSAPIRDPSGLPLRLYTTLRESSVISLIGKSCPLDHLHANEVMSTAPPKLLACGALAARRYGPSLQ